MSKLESGSYLNKEGQIIDLEKKRLAFWFDTVPKDIRRLEYDLWKIYRRLHHVGKYQFENKEKIGRHNIIPPVTPETEAALWESFQGSFLQGQDREKRFSGIVQKVEQDFAKILQSIPIVVRSEIRLGALTGSAVYGPRKEDEELSDIDVNILLGRGDSSQNFEILPKIENPNQYHIIGTGCTDKARSSREQIHWLLYPHYPIMNTYSDAELREIIKSIVVETDRRKNQIVEHINRLNKKLRDKSEGLMY